MYGVSEIKKQNARTKADAQHEREANFSVQSNGGITLRYSGRIKTLEKGRDDTAIAAFLDAVRGQSSGAIKEHVKNQFN